MTVNRLSNVLAPLALCLSVAATPWAVSSVYKVVTFFVTFFVIF